ncbi:MAG TPA: class I SAM-dependent methyltransferase [Chloroflexota bacterium]|nr:class I SAM-dependent methyltransferase [Chloroflexota bacterium]
MRVHAANGKVPAAVERVRWARVPSGPPGGWSSVIGRAAGAPRAPRRWGRWLVWTVITAGTAFSSRWLRQAVDAWPRWRQPGAPASCDPGGARDQQRLADTPLWRLVEARVVERAMRPWRQRPTLRALRILNLDHGPGGIACALSLRAPQDATIVATDPLAGMAELARRRAARRGARPNLHFARAWSWPLPFQDGSFDLVISAGSLHQWPNPEVALAEVRRVLAPHGRFLIVDLRRNVPLWLWLAIRLLQGLVAPRHLRALDEPSASLRAAFAPHEAEWLAARARLPHLNVTVGPVWLMIEGGDVAPQSR